MNLLLTAKNQQQTRYWTNIATSVLSVLVWEQSYVVQLNKCTSIIIF